MQPETPAVSTPIFSRRAIALNAVFALALISMPAAAAATEVRAVGQVPDVAGRSLIIQGTSQDGRHLLLTKRSGMRIDEELWALDTTSTAAIRLADVRNATRFGVSKDGAWVTWAAHPATRNCASDAHVAPTDGSAAPRRISLPVGYRPSWITAITAGARGRVTVRIGPCGDDV